MTHLAQLLPPELLEKIFLFLKDPHVSNASRNVESPPPFVTSILPPGSYTDLDYTTECVLNCLVAGSENRRISGKCDLYASLLTCRSWYYVAVSLLWQKPKFVSIASFVRFFDFLEKFNYNCISHQERTNSKSRPDDQKSLFLPGWHGFSNFRSFDSTTAFMLPNFILGKHVRILAILSPHLQHLSLAKCIFIEDADVMDLVMSLANYLTSLDLSYCRKITSLSIQVAAHFCGPWKKLECIRLRNCALICDDAIKTIAENLGSCIRILDVSGCVRISDAGVAVFLRKSMKNLSIVRRSSLVSSNISPTIYQFEMEISKVVKEENRESDETAVQFQHHLESSGEIKEKKKEEGAGKIVEFRFAGSRKFTRGGFLTVMDELVRNHPNLCTLEFSVPDPPKGSPQPTFSSFPVNLFGRLSSLHINRAKFLSNASIMSLTNLLSNPNISSPLTSLSLNDCLTLAESTLKHILTQLTHLRLLSLRNCPSVNDSIMKHLSISACFPQLNELDFSECTGITSNGIKILVEQAQAYSRKHINAFLRNISTVNEKALTIHANLSVDVKQIALQRILLANCIFVKFDAVIALATNCSAPLGNLQYCDVTGCDDEILDAVDQIIGETKTDMMDQEAMELNIPEFVGTEIDGANHKMRISVVLSGKKMKMVADWGRENAVRG
ncbi:hypothetical protein HK096_006620 [Nowakowskiella sp. JEL0078]|nr:hypothetical protein HK096_006620 [Nowakowskiella sp. JEL0078]